MGLFLATGRAGRFCFEATGKQFPARAFAGSGSGVGVFSRVERRLLLLSGVGLSFGVQVLLSLAGELCSLLDSPPMLNFLATSFTRELFGSEVVLPLRTGLRTTGTIVSGILS